MKDVADVHETCRGTSKELLFHGIKLYVCDIMSSALTRSYHVIRGHPQAGADEPVLDTRFMDIYLMTWYWNNPWTTATTRGFHAFTDVCARITTRASMMKEEKRITNSQTVVYDPLTVTSNDAWGSSGVSAIILVSKDAVHAAFSVGVAGRPKERQPGPPH